MLLNLDHANVVNCARKYGVRRALYYHSSFCKNDPSRAKKLRSLLRDFQNNLPHGRITDQRIGNTVKAHLYNNGNQIKNGQIEAILEAALIDNNQQQLLWENGGKYVFGRSWVQRAKRRWKTNPDKMIIDSRIEISQSHWNEHITDLSSILRRRSRDPLPCRLQRNTTPKIRYEDEDEEDCWNSVLPGGWADTKKLTLLDRLLLPASIRCTVRHFFNHF
jgi:hypothetical protein